MFRQQKEYVIEVILEPHYHDNATNPFFWCLYEISEKNRCNVGCGWAASRKSAFYDALEYYSTLD